MSLKSDCSYADFKTELADVLSCEDEDDFPAPICYRLSSSPKSVLPSRLATPKHYHDLIADYRLELERGSKKQGHGKSCLVLLILPDEPSDNKTGKTKKGKQTNAQKQKVISDFVEKAKKSKVRWNPLHPTFFAHILS
jgi:hypothetical protein